MKKNLIAVFILLFISCASYFAQSIGFGHPNNNAVYASTAYGSTSSTVPVQMMYSFTHTPGLTFYVVKLFADGQEYDDVEGQSPQIPQWFYLSACQHTWTLELYEWDLALNPLGKTASATVTFYVKFTLNAGNNFGSGSINLESATVGSGSTTLKLVGESVAVGAIDQNDGTGYYRVWNTNGVNNSNWMRNWSNILGATSRNYNYSVTSNDNGTTLTADLKKVCTATFQSPTQMTINSSSYTGSASISVVEQNTVTAIAPSMYTTSDWIDYSFTNWTWIGNSSSSTAISPTVNAHTTYTANYSAWRANPSPMNIHFTSSNGQNISLAWTEHPNSNVTQYQVWRWVKYHQDPIAIATLNRGTTSYTDASYIQNN